MREIYKQERGKVSPLFPELCEHRTAFCYNEPEKPDKKTVRVKNALVLLLYGADDFPEVGIQEFRGLRP